MTSVSAVPFYSGNTDFSSSTSIKFSSLSDVYMILTTSNTSVYALSSDVVMIRQSPDLTETNVDDILVPSVETDQVLIVTNVDDIIVHSVETSLTFNCLPTWFSSILVWQDAGLIHIDDVETAIMWLGC